MTMKWKISEAKARFSEMVEMGQREPQVIMNRERPVAVLMDLQTFKRFESFEHEQQRPKIGELLMELTEINQQEDDCEVPRRVDRESRTVNQLAE